MQKLGRAFLLLALVVPAAVLVACTPQTAPRAEFTATPDSGFPPLAVAFDATASSSPNGLIVDYAWQFGDGTTAAGASASHTYSVKGDYVVTLIVRDSAGRTAERVDIVQVLNRAPVARFRPSTQYPTIRQPLQFDASESYDPDGMIVEYLWDFGDGATDSGVVVEHTYETIGESGKRREVTLTVIDDSGDQDVVKRIFDIQGCDTCGG